MYNQVRDRVCGLETLWPESGSQGSCQLRVWGEGEAREGVVMDREYKETGQQRVTMSKGEGQVQW